MSRRRVLVLDGPHAGQWVPDYGQTCELLDAWSAESAMRDALWWMGPPATRTYVKVGWAIRNHDGTVYFMRGYATRAPRAEDRPPYYARVALAAQALLSS